jgi:hypothetical protein
MKKLRDFSNASGYCQYFNVSNTRRRAALFMPVPVSQALGLKRLLSFYVTASGAALLRKRRPR